MIQISANELIYNNLHRNQCNNFHIPNFLDFLWNSNVSKLLYYKNCSIQKWGFTKRMKKLYESPLAWITIGLVKRNATHLSFGHKVGNYPLCYYVEYHAWNLVSHSCDSIPMVCDFHKRDTGIEGMFCKDIYFLLWSTIHLQYNYNILYFIVVDAETKRAKKRCTLSNSVKQLSINFFLSISLHLTSKLSR